MKRLFLNFVAIVSAFQLMAFSARADFMSVGGAEVARNIAEIYVTETGVQINLEVFVGDIEAFENLLPDSWFENSDTSRAPFDERMVEFAIRGISIRRPDGSALPVTADLVEARMRIDRASPMAGQIDPMTGIQMPKPPDDKRVLYVELVYDFEGRRPDSLLFSPPEPTDDAMPVTIGMIVFDRGVPVTDYRFLSKNTELRMDWQDPWYSRFDNPNLMRHHRYPMMTFIYAEPYEIRHEALLRVRDAAKLIGLPLNRSNLAPNEVQTLREALPDVLNDLSPMTVNGASVQPDFERLRFLKIGARGLEYLDDTAEILTDAALIGVIYSHPTDGFAKEATLEWGVFTDQIEMVPGNAIDAAGPFLSNLTKDEPVFTWTNHFKKPPYPEVSAVMVSQQPENSSWLYVFAAIGILVFFSVAIWLRQRSVLTGRVLLASLVLGLAALAIVPVLHNRRASNVVNVSDAELTAMSEALLNNIYRAFSFKLENQVYDRLALTLDGEILEQVYLDQRQALRIERAGGAEARVDTLTVEAVSQLPSPSGTLQVQVDWTVSGRVGHWGHTHRRTNTYRANIMIVPQEGTWKIAAFDVLSQDRLM